MEKKSIFGNHVLFGPSNARQMTISYPPSAYVRVAEVIRVSFSSRELDIRFLDGSIGDTSIYRAESFFGSYAENEGEDKYLECPSPSASVLGKGDRVYVVVFSKAVMSGDIIVAHEAMYVVSKFDTFDYINGNTVSVYPDRVLLEYLTGLCLGTLFKEDDYSSIKMLYNGELFELESNNPNSIINRIPYRLIKELTCHENVQIGFTELDGGNQDVVTNGGGPLPVQAQWYNNSVRQGRRINRLPVISARPYGKTDFTGSLSIYSSLIENVHISDSHPLEVPTLKHYYSGETILWFEDDEPEWVLAIAVYPSWELCKYIKFIEIPVYGWSEIAKNNVDAEEGPTLVEYRRYEKYVREVYSLQRSWIDWNVVSFDLEFSDSLHKALIIPAIKIATNKYKFVIHDGFGLSNGSEILFSANTQKLIYGTVERKVRGSSLAPNGSPFDYEVTHDNALSATTTVSLWYDTVFRYYSVPPEPPVGENITWESQTTTEDTENETWKCYTDGVNTLFKKIAISYYADGYYPSYPWEDGSEPDDLSGLFYIHNSFKEYFFWNSTLNPVCEYNFLFDFTSGKYTVNQSIPVFHYANIELGLFVIELIQLDLENLLGMDMPLDVRKSSHKRKFVAWFQKSLYNLFEVDLPYAEGDLFPPISNFWPWLLDKNTPKKPKLTSEDPSYDVTIDNSSIFYLAPFCWYYVEPAPGYSFVAVSYPTFQGDISSALFASVANKSNADVDLRSDYLRVTVDPRDNSWSIHIKNVFDLTGGRSISFPDGGGSFEGRGSNTLYKLAGSPPQFGAPATTKTIEIK